MGRQRREPGPLRPPGRAGRARGRGGPGRGDGQAEHGRRGARAGCGSRTAWRWPGCSRPTAPWTPSPSPGGARSPTPCTCSGARHRAQEFAATLPRALRLGFRSWAGGSCPTTPSRRRSSCPTPGSSAPRSTCRSSCWAGSTSSTPSIRPWPRGSPSWPWRGRCCASPTWCRRWGPGRRRASLCIHCNKCMPTIYSGTRCVLVDGPAAGADQPGGSRRDRRARPERAVAPELRSGPCPSTFTRPTARTEPLQVRPQFAQHGRDQRGPQAPVGAGGMPAEHRLRDRPRRAAARRQRPAQPGHLRDHLDGARRRAADGRVLGQEHDRQGRVPADRRARAALRQHARRPVARPEEGGATGCSTTGSSEACMLGGLALKWRWRQRRQAAGKPSRPAQPRHGRQRAGVLGEVLPLLGRRSPARPRRARGHLPDRRDGRGPHCDENTIGVVAVLGSTYDGVYEPVAAIAAALDELADSSGVDVPIHVDGASGGFIAPFLDPELEWDFRLPRVHSINTSGHKYGLVYPGVGWVIWRDHDARCPTSSCSTSTTSGATCPPSPSTSRDPGRRSSPSTTTSCASAPTGTARCSRRAGTRRGGWPTRSRPGALRAGVARETASPPSPSASRDAPYTVYDVSDTLRVRGWLVPAYTMPPALDAHRRAAHRGAQRLQP